MPLIELFFEAAMAPKHGHQFESALQYSAPPLSACPRLQDPVLACQTHCLFTIGLLGGPSADQRSSGRGHGPERTLPNDLPKHIHAGPLPCEKCPRRSQRQLRGFAWIRGVSTERNASFPPYMSFCAMQIIKWLAAQAAADGAKGAPALHH